MIFSFCNHVNDNAPSKLVGVDEFLTLRQEVLQLLKTSETPITENVAAPGDDLEAPPGEEPAGATAVVVVSVSNSSCIFPCTVLEFFAHLQSQRLLPHLQSQSTVW